MNTDLKKYIEQCDICHSYSTKQSKEPLICHHIPQHAGEKDCVDIFTLDNRDYLCIIDYYFDLFEVEKLLSKKDAPTVIKALKRYFSNHGIPVKLQSDNGPPFSSHEFADFANTCQFDHFTSSPHYPQSNGKVENAIKTAKRLMKKAKEGKQDFYLSLLSWRRSLLILKLFFFFFGDGFCVFGGFGIWWWY